MDEIVAYQRKIREQWRTTAPCPETSSLDGYSVEIISRAEAVPIILRYEWLGSIGNASHFVGLYSPERELMGVACFGHGPQGNIRQKIGSPAFCLERGACAHHAPPNAASFLISRACKLVARLTGIAIFFAYADPSAGEYGAVYMASSWAYLGQGLDGKSDRRHRRPMVLAPDADPNDPAAWKTTRELRRRGRGQLSFGAAIAAGWRIENRDSKHVYAIYVGRARDRRAWLKTIGADRPYPAPRPHLKRNGGGSA